VRPGPPPKPRGLRVLEGNPAKRPLPPDIRPNVELVMPRHLEGAARAEWRRVVPQLRRLGLATSLDRAALAAYCQAWARWLRAEGQLRRYGELVKAPSGYALPSPYLSIANKAMQQMREFLVEFGMSPAARVRVQPDEDASTFLAPGRRTPEGGAERFFPHD
jgi:P27 family predicted phage terminase small subunit